MRRLARIATGSLGDSLSAPADPNLVNSFINIRVVDIQACYKLRAESREPNLLPSQRTGTVKRAATFAILMVIL